MESLQQFFAVLAVLAALAGALWMLQRRRFARFTGFRLKAPAGRKLEIVERLQLTPQHSVCLIRVEGRTMLIGTAPSGCQRIDGEKA